MVCYGIFECDIISFLEDLNDYDREHEFSYWFEIKKSDNCEHECQLLFEFYEEDVMNGIMDKLNGYIYSCFKNNIKKVMRFKCDLNVVRLKELFEKNYRVEDYDFIQAMGVYLTHDRVYYRVSKRCSLCKLGYLLS